VTRAGKREANAGKIERRAGKEKNKSREREKQEPGGSPPLRNKV
jgi:hypothetical protein